MAPKKFHQNQWERLFEQKRHEFLANDCRSALDVGSFDDLQAGLRQIVSEYQASGFPNLLSRVNPILNHVQSFNNAVTSASQADPRTCLVWGAVQALMQVGRTALLLLLIADMI